METEAEQEQEPLNLRPSRAGQASRLPRELARPPAACARHRGSRGAELRARAQHSGRAVSLSGMGALGGPSTGVRPGVAGVREMRSHTIGPESGQARRGASGQG